MTKSNRANAELNIRDFLRFAGFLLASGLVPLEWVPIFEFVVENAEMVELGLGFLLLLITSIWARFSRYRRAFMAFLDFDGDGRPG